MPEIETPRIGILGAGLMGHGLAQIFAVKKWEVTLYDRDRAAVTASLDRIRSNLEVFVSMGLLKTDEIEPALGHIHLTKTLTDMCQDRDFIIEAISENLDLKRKVFSEMEDHVSPDSILASNTSAIPISSIAEGLHRPERMLGTHFWNPPHIVPCVEVIKGEQTSENVFETTYALMEKADKTPVKVLKDVPGFLGNRMQHALWREAIKLVENGIASAEDVDKVVKNAFGLRMAFLGPLETADLAGLDLTCEIHQDLLPHLDRSQAPSPLLQKKIADKEAGAKNGKGFHDWPADKLSTLVKRRDRVLLRILQQISAD